MVNNNAQRFFIGKKFSIIFYAARRLGNFSWVKNRIDFCSWLHKGSSLLAKKKSKVTNRNHVPILLTINWENSSRSWEKKEPNHSFQKQAPLIFFFWRALEKIFLLMTFSFSIQFISFCFQAGKKSQKCFSLPDVDSNKKKKRKWRKININRVASFPWCTLLTNNEYQFSCSTIWSQWSC